MSGFKETTSLGKYPGVPLTGNAPRRGDYQYIIDQVSSKLDLWKGNHLAFAGRVILAKCVIEALSIYPMMTTKACIKDIHKMQQSVKENSVWKVGDGKIVDAWDSKWIGHDVRIIDMDVHIPLHLCNAKVTNLTSVDGEWNWDVLNRWLPENLTCRIASMLPPSIDAGRNCRKGIGVNENQFYVGAMYEILDEDNRLEKEERWNETWKL
ncbi:hypothetical protein KIW84_060840 [Lathyrus oleraceus]|uniref:Uncharacterized protein n=1 Tax=Pisum sativum TaxID=3888 RepID=A0A9D4W3A9_PEA|nr:hypothetical protein KIW84_060840 [Pisum sativum]